LLEEVRAFLDAVRRFAAPPVTGEDGRRALEVALRINQGMRGPAPRPRGTSSEVSL
jgi:predicted dehydrogenase